MKEALKPVDKVEITVLVDNSNAFTVVLLSTPATSTNPGALKRTTRNMENPSTHKLLL